MAAPTTLLAGIVARFNAKIVPQYTGMTVWMGQVPEQVQPPYVAIKYNCRYEWAFEPNSGYYTEGDLTFYTFAYNLDTVELIAGSITTAFAQNEPLITIAGAEDFSMQQTTYLVDVEPMRSDDQEQVYRAESVFQVRVSWGLPRD